MCASACFGSRDTFWGFSSLYIDIFPKNVHAPVVPCLEYKPRALLLRKLKRVIGFFSYYPFVHVELTAVFGETCRQTFSNHQNDLQES